MKKDLKELKEDIAEGLSAHAEFIPLISKDEEEFLLKGDNIPNHMPILPLRGNVLFPGVIFPIAAARETSIKLLKYAQKEDAYIGVIAQVDDALDKPELDDLYSQGTVARVLKVFDLPNGPTMGVVQGISRFEIQTFVLTGDYYEGDIKLCPEPEEPQHPRLFTRDMRLLRRKYTDLMKLQKGNPDISATVKGIGSDKILINFIASHMEVSTLDKQMVLEADSYEERLMKVMSYVNEGLSYMDVHDEIQRKAQMAMDKQQREYILNQQMKAIQDELGRQEDPEVTDLRTRAAEMEWDEPIEKLFYRELDKLQHSPQQSPDYTVQLNYLNEMLALPWNKCTQDNLNIKNARKILDRDHYGIEKVKERILEQLAVMRLKEDMKAPILCLVGPPGTGKTSLGKSVAEAMGRKYVRIALGGLHDESEIRGHRKTYVGAMPGRIIKGIKRAGSSNPVFILDEIDKVQNQTNQGDPTSALLEVLDPEQNMAFHDNYLDVDYDLSKVLFIATANSLNNIQPALLDRMEVIELSGYVLEEKIEIANRHLIPAQLEAHGFKKGDFKFGKRVLEELINDYTRESGVRQLDKVIAKLIRRRAVAVVNGEEPDVHIKESELKDVLGLPIHNSERRAKEPRVGVVTGLAWTSVGGEILFIESSLSAGEGKLSMTGNLGDVMKESATLAYEYLKANAKKLNISQELIDKSNLHIHVPEGATPKDGPSAGITMFVAMVSAFTKRKVNPAWAMTGEITLRGAVTPVGGIKEKILAAKRAGITDLMLCEENRRDIEDIEQEYLKGLTFHYINEMSEALDLVFI